jgi:hypothetical protein
MDRLGPNVVSALVPEEVGLTQASSEFGLTRPCSSHAGSFEVPAPECGNGSH